MESSCNKLADSDIDCPTQTSDVVDIYLKKHKLDLKLLPNKKLIKLSDITFSKPPSSEISLNKNNLSTSNERIKEIEEPNGKIYLANEDQEIETKSNKKTRKKREPSLKLKQKLTNQDLELIVSSLMSKQASVFIADVKKDEYVDKILRVKLDSALLSNGSNEALLKKSMFPKEINTLFDTFINALCGQDCLVDENGINKPTLRCLVIDCDFNSFSEAEIMRHIKRHLAQDGYTCPECSHQFASMTNLQRHMKIHSGDVGKEMMCPHCDYKASTITHVKRHMAHKHLERSLPCPHCSFMGATNAELKIHMARKHLELTGKNPLFLPKYLRKDYQCNVCKEQFNDFKEYQTHMYEHTSSSNRFRCNECPYNCKNYSKLKRHMLYHIGARNFECKICGNKFFQMEHLKRHMQSIHNSKLDINSSSTKKITEKTDNNNSNIAKQSQPRSKSPKDLPNNQHLSQFYTVLAKCLYKCQKCQFLSEELFILNQHMINEHFDEIQNQISKIFLDNSNSFDNEESDLSDEDDKSEIQNKNDFFKTNTNIHEQNIEFNDQNCLGNILSNFTYFCSFCSFKTNRKAIIKSHLKKNHSSDVTNPIFLNNDALIVDPNTKFQCGSCNCLFENINDFTKHMNDEHKINVYLVDLPNETSNISNQDQLNTEKEITTDNYSSSIVLNKNINQNTTSNQQKNIPATRQLKNGLKYSNLQQTSVRINPVYLKQAQNYQLNNQQFQQH